MTTRRAVALLLGALLLGAAVWAGWLWDADHYWDERRGVWQGPYTETQVIGCALTYGLVTAVLSARLNRVLVTVGMAGGFWTAWTVHAANTDETGLFLVGSVLLGLALLVGGAIASASGRGAHVLWQRRRSPGRRA